MKKIIVTIMLMVTMLNIACVTGHAADVKNEHHGLIGDVHGFAEKYDGMDEDEIFTDVEHYELHVGHTEDDEWYAVLDTGDEYQDREVCIAVWDHKPTQKDIMELYMNLYDVNEVMKDF